MSDYAPDPIIGEVVGPYRVEALLGVGGMGRVYRALDGEGLGAQLTDMPEDPCAARVGAPGLAGAVLQALAEGPAERPASSADYVGPLCAGAGISPQAGNPLPSSVPR